MQAHGRQQPTALLESLPAVLDATRDGAGAVRGSALATTAAFLGALGTRVLPQLAPAVAAVLSAAEAAAAALPAEGRSAEARSRKERVRGLVSSQP